MDHARHQLDPIQSEGEDNPEVLRGKIQQTRADIGETVNTLQDRLSPERVKREMKMAARAKLEAAKVNVRVKTEEWQNKATERIVNNPIPAAMVGIGLVCLLKQASGSYRQDDPHVQHYYSLDPDEDWPDYAPERAEGRVPHRRSRPQDSFEAIKAKAQTSGQQAREHLSDWTAQAQNSLKAWKVRTSHRTDQALARMRERGERTKGEFRQFLEEHPLTAGVMTFAIGAAVGLSLPRSQREDQWLGETRDRLLEEAKATAKQILPKAEETAGEIKRAVRTAVKEQAE